MDSPRASVAVIGGSGLYELFDEAIDVDLETPYGCPSDALSVGLVGGVRVVFLARHGRQHRLPPHRVPYRANMWALASLGVRAVVSTSAVGGLSTAAAPEIFVLPDQLIDRTWGRPDTYFDGPEVEHLTFADPYCATLRGAAMAALTALGERFEPTGTVAVIPGPRFSTRAESQWLRAMGADIVNMTQYPEAVLAAELGMGLVNVSFVTDSDAGAAGTGSGDDDPVTAELVMRRLTNARPRLVAAVTEIIARIPEEYDGQHLLSRAAVEAVMRRPVGAGTQ